ncbi:MAG: NADH:flavin oxidoreductase/NADH oxidase [Acetobacteraceae bacterium]|nr:NADH:flavin oxidoreductase/NADH oxidase [Acetobacteraceae bacterium]
MTQPLLFTPLQIRSVPLKNRVVLAPMHQYASNQGFATDWHLMNAGKFAAGGVGLVMIESTKVERRGCGTVGDLGLWKDEFIPGLQHLTAFIKAQQAVPGIQIGHSGRKARLTRPWEGQIPLTADHPEMFDWDGWELVAPSAIAHSERMPTPRAFRRDEIPELVARWGDAARRAHQAGFEVLEIHGAHGYLIHQFLSPVANRRNDEYGGSDANRMRFALEVADCVRAAWPQDKPLFMRLSCEDDAGWGPDQSVALARALKTKGVDVIDCSSGGILERSPMDSERSKHYGYQVPYAEKIRAEAGIATMAVGHIVHADQAEAILQSGRADLIALARELLYNPNWAMDAAQKLGADPDFRQIPPNYAYWLGKRAKSGFEGVPSTFLPGLRDAVE